MTNEHDSREKLLEDANALAVDYWDMARTWVNATDLMRDVIALLDRQAAITTRKCTAVNELGCEACRAAQKREIASVQAKVDELNAQNTRLNEGWSKANVQVEKLQAQLAQCKESYADAKASRDRLQAQLDSAKYDCLTCDAKAELQAKVAELQAKLDAYDQTHMPLPVDADGAPIHIGDRLLKSTGAQKESFGEVVGISEDSVWFDYNGNGYESNWANLTRHVKQRTVEDVLAEFGRASIGATLEETNELLAKYADELRWLGVCDE